MAKKSTFFADFKKFITRGNIIDMSVGVIVGGAFTAVVNSMSNNILKPFINWILTLVLGKNSLSEIYTFLKRVDKTDELGNIVPDLTESIYIDWGALINAIINFLVIAFVLFTVVRLINSFREFNGDIFEAVEKNTLSRKERRELKEHGVDIRNKDAVKAYFEEKVRLAKEAEEREKQEAEARAAAERAANPTSEDLLKEIRDLLKNSVTES